MEIPDIFTAKFIFDPNPPVQSDFYLPLLICFGILILAGLAIMVFARGDWRKFYRPYVAPFLTAGILGNIHLFARYEMLPWLSTRFFLLLVVTSLVIWLAILAVVLSKEMIDYRSEKATNERFEKYLPKTSRKSKD